MINLKPHNILEPQEVDCEKKKLPLLSQFVNLMISEEKIWVYIVFM